MRDTHAVGADTGTPVDDRDGKTDPVRHLLKFAEEAGLDLQLHGSQARAKRSRSARGMSLE